METSAEVGIRATFTVQANNLIPVILAEALHPHRHT